MKNFTIVFWLVVCVLDGCFFLDLFFLLCIKNLNLNHLDCDFKCNPIDLFCNFAADNFKNQIQNENKVH